MSHVMYKLAFVFALTLGASSSFAQPSPLQNDTLATLQSWKAVLAKQVQIDNQSFLTKYFGQALALDLKHVKESQLSPDQKKIVKTFSQEGTGWVTCVTVCVIHVRQNNIVKASTTIDHIVAQNIKDQQAYEEGLRAEAERYKQQQIAQAQAVADENARQAATAKELENLIEANKNTRVQLPAIAGDWYFQAYQNFDPDTIRMVTTPDGNIVEQTCRDDAYWLSGRQLCIITSQKTLYYNLRLNGFCDAQATQNCNYVVQVSTDEPRRLIIVGQPFTKLTIRESSKIYRYFTKIDKDFQSPKNFPIIPNAVAAMENQTANLLGPWNETSKADPSNGMDSNILFISKDAPGLLRVLSCDLQVWKATNGNRCQDRNESQTRYYYNPEFAGFCKLGDRCSRGIKFANNQLGVVSDPLGSRNFTNRGQVLATFEHAKP